MIEFKTPGCKATSYNKIAWAFLDFSKDVFCFPWSQDTSGFFHWCLNTLRPRQNGRHFPDDIFKWISLNENIWISINISLKLVPRGPINNIPTLVQVMAWRRPGDKPLTEPIVVRLLTHICVTRPQSVKCNFVNMMRNWLFEFAITIHHQLDRKSNINVKFHRIMYYDNHNILAMKSALWFLLIFTS